MNKYTLYIYAKKIPKTKIRCQNNIMHTSYNIQHLKFLIQSVKESHHMFIKMFNIHYKRKINSPHPDISQAYLKKNPDISGKYLF